MICSTRPAFCGFYSSEQLTRLMQILNSLALQIEEAEISAEGFSLPAAAFAPGSLGSPPPNPGVLQRSTKDWGNFYNQVLELTPFQDSSPTILAPMPAPNSFLLLCSFCLFLGCPPVPSNSCLICTYIFSPHCIIVTCGEFSAISLLHHYQKLGLSGFMFNLFIIGNLPGARGLGKGKQYMRTGVRGV